MTKKNINFFRIAEAVASLSPHKRVSIGAIIVIKKTIVSSACNSYKTHPVQKLYDSYRMFRLTHHYLHAETKAILNAKDRDLSNAVIYIYRKNKNGVMANCRPCEACMKFIQSVGIKKIYYTTSDGYCEETLEQQDTHSL